MRILCLLFILSILPIEYANAQQVLQQGSQQQWGGMTNPRARRARPADNANKNIGAPTFGDKAPENIVPAKNNVTTPENRLAQPTRIKTTTATEEKSATNTNTKKTNANLPPLTDGMAERIAQMKGKSVSWADYEMYPYEEDTTGYYVRIYKLNNGMTMNIGGPSTDYEPRYIYITDGNGNVVKALKDY